ncbi:hypothetical protein CBL_10421 [Carabus blaptoides fortunei]
MAGMIVVILGFISSNIGCGLTASGISSSVHVELFSLQRMNSECISRFPASDMNASGSEQVTGMDETQIGILVTSDARSISERSSIAEWVVCVALLLLASTAASQQL